MENQSKTSKFISRQTAKMMANLKRLRIILIIGAVLGIVSMVFAASAVDKRVNPDSGSSRGGASYQSLSQGEEVTVGDFTYKLTGSSLTLVSYSGTGNAVEIPGTVRGYTVTAVADNAFSGNKTIASVTFSNSVISIGAGAFRGCTSLINVELPSSLRVIGDNAFSGCGMLRAVILPESLASISPTAFRGCADGFKLYVVGGSESESYAQSNGYEYDYATPELIG